MASVTPDLFPVHCVHLVYANLWVYCFVTVSSACNQLAHTFMPLMHLGIHYGSSPCPTAYAGNQLHQRKMEDCW